MFSRLAQFGSSPRVRGKRPPLHQPTRSPRLIPACAGKTASAASWTAFWAAHPRVCGENSSGEGATSRISGSSPRVRGKRPRPAGRPQSRRLIPACAGKTKPLRVWPRRASAHPRVCGENHMAPSSAARSGGSSPRVRGKQAAFEVARGDRGLIPACAGKTRPMPGRRCSGWAHPRVCGENSTWNRRLVA